METTKIIIVICVLLGIIIILSRYLIKRNKEIEVLKNENKNLSNRNNDQDIELVFLRQLGCDVSSMGLSAEVINALPEASIRKYHRNIYQFYYSRINTYTALFLGQKLFDYLQDITDHEKREFFSAVMEQALIQQPESRLINLFIDDLKEEIIKENYVYFPTNNQAKSRKIFRDWFLEAITKKGNFAEIGKKVLASIKKTIPELYKISLGQGQVDQFFSWSNKIDQLITDTEKLMLTIKKT